MYYNPSISKEEMSSLPVEQFSGKTVVVDNMEIMKDSISIISTFDYVGFDTETKPNFSKNQHHKVSLMQIATPDCCFLFRLNKLKGIPQELENFLKDGKTIKVGLSLLDDFHNIRKIIKIESSSFIDLQKIVTSYGIQDASLQKIYAILFGKKISKRMQLTNWEADRLTDAQKKYAALDAWACLMIYQKLINNKITP